MKAQPTLLVFAATLAVAASVTPATAQEWQPDTIEFIISHSVGGGQTPATHLYGKYWMPLLGATNATYENKDGASQRIGYEYFMSLPEAKNCEALLSSNPSNAVIMYLQQKPNWNWEDSIVPVGLMAEMPGYWFVRADSPIQDLDDLLAQAKERTLTVAMANYASSDNLQLHQVTDAVGAQFEVVPTDGAGKAMASVLGGHVDFGVNKLDSLLTAGDGIRAIAALMPSNPVPELTQNAPSLDEHLGIQTIRNSSIRSILATKECADNHPDRFMKLQETFEEVKLMEGYLSESDVPPMLIPKGEAEAVNETLQGYQAAFDKYGKLFNN